MPRDILDTLMYHAVNGRTRGTDGRALLLFLPRDCAVWVWWAESVCGGLDHPQPRKVAAEEAAVFLLSVPHPVRVQSASALARELSWNICVKLLEGFTGAGWLPQQHNDRPRCCP